MVKYEAAEYSMYNFHHTGTKPMIVELSINQQETQMEVDTGATLSIISKATFNKLLPQDRPVLKASDIKLKTITGESITVEGSIEVDALYQQQVQQLTLEGSGPSLMGCN